MKTRFSRRIFSLAAAFVLIGLTLLTGGCAVGYDVTTTAAVSMTPVGGGPFYGGGYYGGKVITAAAITAASALSDGPVTEAALTSSIMVIGDPGTQRFVPRPTGEVAGWVAEAAWGEAVVANRVGRSVIASGSAGFSV